MSANHKYLLVLFSVSCCTNVSVRLRHKKHIVRVRKRSCFSSKYSVMMIQADVSTEIFCGFTPTNVETQTWTVVSGFAAFSPGSKAKSLKSKEWIQQTTNTKNLTFLHDSVCPERVQKGSECFGLKYLFCCQGNSWKCLKVVEKKKPSGFTFTNVETQTWTVVSGLAAVSRYLHISLNNLLAPKQSHKKLNRQSKFVETLHFFRFYFQLYIVPMFWLG